MATVKTSRTPPQTTRTADDTPAEWLRSGLIAGLILGIVLSATFWTHAPDLLHAFIGLGIALGCALAGGGLGWLVGHLHPDDTHTP